MVEPCGTIACPAFGPQPLRMGSVFENIGSRFSTMKCAWTVTDPPRNLSTIPKNSVVFVHTSSTSLVPFSTMKFTALDTAPSTQFPMQVKNEQGCVTLSKLNSTSPRMYWNPSALSSFHEREPSAFQIAGSPTSGLFGRCTATNGIGSVGLVGCIPADLIRL